MGTLFSISLYALNIQVAEAAADAAFHRIDQLETLMSDYQADSELNLLRTQPVGEPVPISSDLYRILAISQDFARLTEGAFDPTVGPYVRLWRFSKKRKELPTAADLAKARAAVGWQKLVLNKASKTVTLLAPSMQLDLGGIAKGFAADEALAVLENFGITQALVAASGDIVVSEPPPGQRAWRVQVSSMPGDTNKTEILMLRNAAVSTSGDAEQFIEIEGVRYSHIVNPATGLGLTERVQVTVIGPDATTTDALATAVSVMGRERGLKVIESIPKVSALLFAATGGEFSPYPSKRFHSMVD